MSDFLLSHSKVLSKGFSSLQGNQVTFCHSSMTRDNQNQNGTSPQLAAIAKVWKPKDSHRWRDQNSK